MRISHGKTTMGGSALEFQAEKGWHTVVIERTLNNYAAYVPGLPGCVTTASTRGELSEEIREATGFHLHGMREDGEPIPEPQALPTLWKFRRQRGEP